MIVIGGKSSSNSKELFENVSKITKSFFIQKPEEVYSLIEQGVFNVSQKIGITAGASTMNEDILLTKSILENNFRLDN